VTDSPQALLVKKLLFGGKIISLTGLHIGGSETGLSIGGADKVVVRNPRDNAPYIPGSSLKGKMRSLLERIYCVPGASANPQGCRDFVQRRGEDTLYGPCRCAECDVCRLFGVAIDQKRPLMQAGRLLVRDALMANCDEVRRMSNLATDFTELKTEVSIDRLTSAANPRNFERVPAGASFDFELVLNVFKDDDEPKFVKLVQEALRLIAYDALGGQSSRGYGRVAVRLERRNDLEMADFQSDQALRAALQRNAIGTPLLWPEEVRELQPAAA